MGDHLIFRRAKEGITRNGEPKRGHRLKLWKDLDGESLKFAWKMKTWRGSRKSSEVLGTITSVK